MEISDLTGLSNPLTRLIEVISDGIGRLSEPYLTRKQADAKAYEIAVISRALKDVADQHRLPVVYEHGQVEVWQKPDDHTLDLEANPLAERISQRLDYQERKRQKNIESITSVAAQELNSESEVPEEKPDEDWISRFFSVAPDVSSEQMQDLWGRILAGEIRKPGSFSLRTLEFVKNLTKSEAELIEHVGKYCFEFGDVAFVPTHDKEWLKVNLSIYPRTVFNLGELGITYPSELRLKLFTEDSTENEAVLHGDSILIIKRGGIKNQMHLSVWKFTEVGREMLQLIPIVEANHLIASLGKFFVSNQAIVSVGKILERRPNGEFKYEIVREMGN